jgi:hypothetical protein
MSEHRAGSPFGDLLALQLSQRREQCEHEPTHRRARVDALLDDGQISASRAQTLGKVDGISGAPREPGERIDAQDGLPLASQGDRFLQARPVVRAAAR